MIMDVVNNKKDVNVCVYVRKCALNCLKFLGENPHVHLGGVTMMREFVSAGIV